MTEYWPWTKAGVRRDPRARQRAAARRAQAAAARERDDEVAYQKWRAGMVVPRNITVILDACGLYGPEVDEACRAQEPEVDLWEAGKLYPRWDQLVALAELTGTTPRWFTEARPAVPVIDTSMRFHAPPGELRQLSAHQLMAVMRYPDDVVARCPGTELHAPTASRSHREHAKPSPVRARARKEMPTGREQLDLFDLPPV